MTKKEFLRKYDKNVMTIAQSNHVDTGVAGDMFIHNAQVISAAAEKAGKDWYKGTGAVNVDQLRADLAAYVASLPKTPAKK